MAVWCTCYNCCSKSVYILPFLSCAFQLHATVYVSDSVDKIKQSANLLGEYHAS